MGRSGGAGAGRSGGGRSGGSRSGGGRSARSTGSMGRPSGGFSGSSRPSGGASRPGGMGGPGSFDRPGGGFGGPGGFGPGGRPPHMPPHRPPRRPLWGPRRRYYGPAGGHYIGCGGYLLSIIMLMLVLGIIFGAMSGGNGGASYTYTWSSTKDSINGITKSTVERERLELKFSDAAGYYTDTCDWIRNETTLVNGLKKFYDKTGILPYVYIIDNVEGDYDPSTEKLEQFAEEQYAALFGDEGHILLVFWDYGGAYEYTLWLGEDTLELMDREACDILFDYLDYYYYAADTEDAFFADSFADAGERIMTVNRSTGYYVVRIGITAVLVIGVIWFIKKRTEEKEEVTI